MTSEQATERLAGTVRGFEVGQLAARVDECGRRLDAIMTSFRNVQLLGWESPAGRAYRDFVAVQEVALRRAGDRTYEAALAVRLHSRSTGDVGWPVNGWP